ncbi:hypothetical protein D9613_007831 [Agrocybe pediades]|uniref:Autophagy-related protein n=1 Tax=Agrocybe pediades TaxID=84607 RepID=A0A8H4QN57_9AGAR|nr:hypothetical protein D9613_007831 [Agrocybe pediades]
MSAKPEDGKTPTPEPKEVDATLDDTQADKWTTTRVELWSYYLYYVGNNGLSGFNFGPSQFQNLLFLAGYDPTVGPGSPCSINGCVLPYLGKIRDINSIVLLTNGISFAIQAALLLPNITIFFTLFAIGVSFAWLGVEDPSQWRAGVALYILGLITYQVCFLMRKPSHHSYRFEEHETFHSISRNRISNISFAICSAGEIVILAVMVGILRGLRSDQSTENNTKAFSVLIAFSGAVWLLCALPWFFFEKRRPGLELPPGISLLTIGFRQIVVAFRECLRLKQTFLYLIFYFLMGDVLNTAVTGILRLHRKPRNTDDISVVSYSTLDLTLLLIVGIVAQGLGIYVFWLVQKRYKISTKAMLSFVVLWILILTIWGLIGIHTNKFGFKHVWEIWYAVSGGLWFDDMPMVCIQPDDDKCKLMYDLGQVLIFRTIFGCPLVSSAIVTASGNNNNMPFAFLFGLGVFSTIFLWQVDVHKSRIECDEFILAERSRKAFQTSAYASGEPGSIGGN